MSTAEYQQIKNSWPPLSTEINKNKVNMKGKTTIQLALVGSKTCLVMADKNKLMTINVVLAPPPHLLWYKPTNGPCPIQDPEGFEKGLLNSQLNKDLNHPGSRALTSPSRTTPIYLEMTDSSKNSFWNGIGTSHATEILHLAKIHPETPTFKIFAKSEPRTRLCEAIGSYFQQAYSPEYLKRVPATTTSHRAFEFSPSVTQYINSQFTKVYRKTETSITLAHYNFLQSQGLLSSDSEALPDGWEINCFTDTGKPRQKKVEVYTLAFESRSSSEKNKEKKNVISYTYTCIYKQPTGRGRILTKEEAIGKQLKLDKTGKRAEIGIASFMDTIQEETMRKKEQEIRFSKRVAIKTGASGRPLKRKKSMLDLNV
jgi:hypothetical protein